MPWKNPRCNKCHGRTRQGKIIDDKRCMYVCRDKRCGHEEIGWRHVTDESRRLQHAYEIAMREKRRRQ